ncbi:transcriptional regulatory protein BtsR [Clostridiales bacterium]|nr:transcriptional regulatory protein BtsR [Clostridiales bacterium]
MADAFEVEAIDYLCKPIDKVRLENALRRVIKKNNAEKRIVSQMSGDIKTVKLSDIYYCEVLNRKIYLNTKHGEVEFYGRLKDIEQGLDFRFMKCHRSYIINLDFLWEYKKDHIILINGVKIPVSRPKRKSVEEKIVRYIREETR